jgi:GDPmannose 4,6-dehydratase
MGRRTLIVGVSGQDGAYLAKRLLDRGDEVIGTSRDAQECSFTRLSKLGIKDDIQLKSLAPMDFRSVLVEVQHTLPDEIYFLAGQTSVGLSFEQPVECMQSIAGSILNFLEVIRLSHRQIKLFSAGSSECFGETSESERASETSKFKPKSPYGVAKANAFWQVAAYREAYDIFACTGILANHESTLRSERFVIKKIIQGIKKIEEGTEGSLRLGNCGIYRDWGWAPEYVEAIEKMLDTEEPRDYVIASGNTVRLRDFVQEAFRYAGLEMEDFLEYSHEWLRPCDIEKSYLDASKIKTELGWETKSGMKAIIEKMFKEELY